MNSLNAVQRHYTSDDLAGKLNDALQKAGFGEPPIDWASLAPIDQFHIGGLEATRELAQALDLTGNESFLDIGCGFGGPARFLAGQYGCRVTGIDLTPAYIEIAKDLAHRTGLEDRLTFLPGDATDLPFPDASFDAAWMMHVGMNVEDKERLFAGIYRVLRPGGRLAVYDILQGEGGPLLYPLPWAKTPETSFMATEEEIVAKLGDAGFSGIGTTDRTAPMMEWFAAFRTAAPPSGPRPINMVALVLGADGPAINANVVKNLAEGRGRIVRFLAHKA